MPAGSHVRENPVENQCKFERKKCDTCILDENCAWKEKDVQEPERFVLPHGYR